jgi:hypothetical protein
MTKKNTFGFQCRLMRGTRVTSELKTQPNYSMSNYPLGFQCRLMCGTRVTSELKVSNIPV